MKYLIIGLGNPGKQYEHTRHNAGFMALDALAAKFEFPECKLHKKSESLISEGRIDGADVLCAKPQTLMNNSGLAAKLLYAKYKILNTKYLVVVHDDIDLPLGQLKISFASGSAGHKGVESIIEQLGTKDFIRIRIGIQPLAGKPEDVENFVLRKFTPQELQAIRKTIDSIPAMLQTIIDQGLDQAMSLIRK
ncbi:MAG: aminoacyl-tRNA hydrolase [Candidatus Wildermuthbacteria bacterium]|nr:aminoacyl-tRNA hydrolase [Candidatus Wildermuthbacteria bacterium]